MNEKAIFAEDAFDVSLDEPNSTEYANPVDLKRSLIVNKVTKDFNLTGPISFKNWRI